MINEYADRDIMGQRDHYAKHVQAMTSENLHCKSDIAAELAHRDIRIAELEDNQSWISVEDRLPDFHKSILFTNKKTVFAGAFYSHSHKFISDGNKFHKSDVGYWMPLPEAPKEDKS
jgi:hypothetical protein